VFPAFQPRDGWLCHADGPREISLAQAVNGPVLDDENGDIAGDRVAIPLVAELLVLTLGVDNLVVPADNVELSSDAVFGS